MTILYRCFIMRSILGLKYHCLSVIIRIKLYIRYQVWLFKWVYDLLRCPLPWWRTGNLYPPLLLTQVTPKTIVFYSTMISMLRCCFDSLPLGLLPESIATSDAQSNLFADPIVHGHLWKAATPNCPATVLPLSISTPLVFLPQGWQCRTYG